MSWTALRRIVLLASLFAMAIACGDKETPEQKLARLRYNHEIVPTGYATIHAPDGGPVLVVDLRIANQGTQKLDALTVLVEVHGADGGERLARRVTLDLSDLQPGTGTQIAAQLPGIQVADDDEVSVLIESGLSDEDLRSLPEYQDALDAK